MEKISISVYQSHSRIRIHRNTLDFLGNPPYVILVVNPKEKALGIMGSQKKTPLSHHIYPRPSKGKLNCELYSTTLFHELRSLCPYMNGEDGRRSWCFRGRAYPSENMAVFSLNDPKMEGDI